MNHLVRFNESTSGKRKKVLSISNIDYIYRLLSGLGCRWVYRKDFKGQRHDCKVVMQKVLNKDGQSGVIILKFRNIEDGIMRRAYKNQDEETKKNTKNQNAFIQKARYVIERTFGGIVLWFNGKRSRYFSLDKAECFNGFMAIAYNLKRLHGLLKLQ